MALAEVSKRGWYPPRLESSLKEKWGATIASHGADTVEFGWRLSGKSRDILDAYEGRAGSTFGSRRLGRVPDQGGKFEDAVPGVVALWHGRHSLLKVSPTAVPGGRSVDGLGAWVADAVVPALHHAGIIVAGVPAVHRCDVFVEVEFREPSMGRRVFDALAASRWDDGRWCRRC